MFQRKVHPENSSAARNSKRDQKIENKRKIIHNDSWNNGDQIFHEEDIMLRPQKALPKHTTGHNKNQFDPPQFMLNRVDSNGNREHWIKTDADCKNPFPKVTEYQIFWSLTLDFYLEQHH